MFIAFGSTGVRNAKVSGLLRNVLTSLETCCNPSFDPMMRMSPRPDVNRSSSYRDHDNGGHS